ncbi:DUF2141 domain-containing protein [Nonlabens ulvanivorans]|uniref:Uncharacterized protein (DUF2141 family) n=1 Tax=Nonlabens ulvanivorans TaxID=906888 RepID=A0A084JVS6_NONUL|nr:DUF2141 domain-containing protein [Nonlabens ulvanivorans]KEZ93060.1 hypothetical protein IL45_13100 [Nonlabens ulvanivorans]PRX12710.1 uncharacterized protein (DUF2141 family) [Nonlabens ulvanivorans]
MKTIITTIALFISLLSFAQETTHTLKVTVPNATSDKGEMVFALNTKETFMVAAPVQSAAVKIEDGVATVTFENVAPGEYAIIVLHDLNGNQRMDFKDGMPAENYNVSGGQMSFGPPVFGDSKFTLKEDTEMTIRL